MTWNGNALTNARMICYDKKERDAGRHNMYEAMENHMGGKEVNPCRIR